MVADWCSDHLNILVISDSADPAIMSSARAIPPSGTMDSATNEVSSDNPHRQRKPRDRKRKHQEIEQVNESHDITKRKQSTDLSQFTNLQNQDVGRSSKKRRKHKTKKTSWKVSEPVGGLLADLLPIFSSDEEHLLLGYSHSVKIYSTATSMLVRACQTGGIQVSSFCLSSHSNKTLYILLQDGKIQWWDWTTGEKLKTWDLGAQVSDLSVSTLSTTPDALDTLFIAESRNGSSEITAHRLLGNEETKAKSLYRDNQQIRTIRTLDQGQYIVAVTARSVIVGTRLSNASTKFKQLRYKFNTFEAPEPITCFDVRLNPGAASKHSHDGNIDIAVGLADGSIRVYYGAATSTEPKVKQQQPTPANEKLHWHREAVSSIAWASNGNYVLSGGSETVLVLWQLDTKTKTTLPHLTSRIEAVTVSPKGSSYAIRLADNSVMVLGTADFVPTFNSTGLGLPTTRLHEEDSLESLLPHRRTPVACNSVQLPRLVTAVPSDHPDNRALADEQSGLNANTSLQSMPLSNLTTSINRQALVETHATEIRRRPDGKLVSTANVVLLAISQDGNWMATIDEWYQPLDDILPNSGCNSEARAKQLATMETNLVFWRWNEATEMWDRSTRIVNPHSNESGVLQSSALILDLVAGSKPNTFWTVGSDGCMKHWKAHRRAGPGSRATNTAVTISEYIWKCISAIAVPRTSLRNDSDSFTNPSARLTISRDGSMFAVTEMSSKGSELVLFTAQPDDTTKTFLNFYLEHSGVSTALLNQYLIMADCESVVVRDLTDSTRWYKATFGSNALPSDLAIPPHIAVDHEHQRFAISVPRQRKSEGSTKSRKSRITIFSPLSSSPIAVLDNQPLSAALLCVPEQRRFYALTTQAEIYSISPNVSENMTSAVSLEMKESDDEMSKPIKESNMLSNIFGDDAISKVEQENENTTVADNATQRKKIAWEELPGLNLDQPFTLPKTSIIQMMSAMAARG